MASNEKEDNRCFLELFISMDKNFIFGAGALLVSLHENNTNMKFRVHIVASKTDLPSIKKKLCSRIEGLYTKIFEFELYSFENFGKFHQLNKALNRRMAIQCGRLLIGDIKKFTSDKVLFIDADIVCLGSIDALVNTKLSDEEIIVASPEYRKNCEICGHHVYRYFWGGVMLIDVNKWNALKIGDKCTDFVCKYKPKHNDQDAVNVILNRRWQAFPDNFQSIWNIHKDTVFLHYVAAKPWEPWHFYDINRDAVKVFRKYARIFEPNVSNWISFKHNKDTMINFNSYSPRFSSKWISRLMLKRGMYRGWIYFLIKHLIIKVCQKGLLGFFLMRSNTRT